MSEYAGIDYGLGQTNINLETKIRYGVISQRTVGQAWYDDSEADYGDAQCPECGNKAESSDGFDDDLASKDYFCRKCAKSFWSDDVFSGEPLGFSYEDNEYTLTSCLNSDIMVIKSPYYTRAQFCSPCVPGAGNLNKWCSTGPKTYCLGHDWFEDNKAPYRVYDVATGEEILSGEK